MEVRWILFLFLVNKMCYIMAVAPCTSVDPLYLGCFTERFSDKEFVICAGNYNASDVSPVLCVNLCGYLSYKYSALQNGNFCLCGNSYGKHGAVDTCDKPCSGDAKTFCGGEAANNVYNATPFVGRFSIDIPGKSVTLFDRVNLTITFTNGTVVEPGISVDDGQGTGFSTFSSANTKYSYHALKWGIQTVKARHSVGQDYKTAKAQVKIASQAKHVKIDCPIYVKTTESFKCTVLVYQGTDMQATWRFAQGPSGNYSLPDPVYLGIGPPIPQWTLTNLASPDSSGVFLIPSSVFINDAIVLGWEVYGITAGIVTLFVARPQCITDSQQYCINNATCISSSLECKTKVSHKCTAPESLSLTSSSCQDSNYCNSSVPGPAVYQSKIPTETYSAVCVYTTINIKTGYNLFVIPDNNVCQGKKGDILGWAIAGSGRIAHRNDAKKVLKFTTISLPLAVGTNITKDQPRTEIPAEYLMKAVSAQGAALLVQHTINKVGSDYFHVEVTNNMTSGPVKSFQEIRAQQSLSWLSAAYPQGFSYLGTAVNRPVELILNVSAATNITVLCKNITSGQILFNFVNQANGAGVYFFSKANRTFVREGLFTLYVEASNEISSFNTTINIFVTSQIVGLNGNLSQPDQPVYMGLQTSLVATVSSSPSRLRYKWIFTNDDTGLFIESSNTSYNFKEAGVINVTLIASNQVFISNMSFTVTVLNPLSITAPQWNSTNKAVSFSCSLKGPFSVPQVYIWRFGDGSNKTGNDLKSVQHTFTKGDKYNISCSIQNDASIFANKTVLILEPVTGGCLRPLRGVKLSENKTFSADYATGNNLTYDWVLQSGSFAMISICTDKYFTFHFTKPGAYNVSLWIRNAISSIKCFQTFFVDEAIANVSIKAYPNPAQSNSTVRFEISKVNGTNVTYKFDFGDGSNHISVVDDAQWEFNRTFTAKKWQVILTANNSISNIIVFYSLTVQDVISDISVNVNQDGTLSGKPYVAVGVTKELRCQVMRGTDVFFRWMIDGHSYDDKGEVQKSGQSLVLRSQTFNKEQEVYINVTAKNLVSRQNYGLVIYAQDRIQGFLVEAPEGVMLNQEFTVNFQQTKGSNVAYRVKYDDGSPDVSTTNSYVKKMFTSQRKFVVTISATNQVSNATQSKTVAVQTQIEGLRCSLSKQAAAIGENVTLFWNITKGNDVIFHVDYNDGSSKSMNESIDPAGKPFQVHYSFKVANTYQMTITAKNFLFERRCTARIQIEQPINNLKEVQPVPSKVTVFQKFTIEVSVDAGSNVKYVFNFGDGLDPVITSNGRVSYEYRYPRNTYILNITASNSISSSSLIKDITVNKETEVLSIRGVKVIAKATKFGEATKIQIITDSGSDFSCTVSGENIPVTKLLYSELNSPMTHYYSKPGTYKIEVKCKNEISEDMASTITTVEEPIEGLKFQEKYQSEKLEFGISHEFNWTWTKGSHVKSTIVLLLKKTEVKTIQNVEVSKFTLVPEYVNFPGTYTIRIDVFNSVTKTQSISADIILIQRISEVKLNVNPYVQKEFPVMMFLEMKTGSHATSVWFYGEGNGTEILQSKDSNRFISSKREFKSPGQYNITVVVWNHFSSGNTSTYATVSIMNPVAGFQAPQLGLLRWPLPDVVFRFTRDNNTAAPTNARFQFDYGDDTEVQSLPLNSSLLHFSHSHEYKIPGCYNAKLKIFNEASHVEFKIPVKIAEKIENLTIQAVQSGQSSFPDQPGYGKDKNMFPLEYPVSFRVTYSKGACVNYQWLFGDNETMKSDSYSTADHLYPLVGNYVVHVKAFNSLDTKTKSFPIETKRSILGLYLVSSSPSKPGKRVTFVVFCFRTGNDSSFVLDTGDKKNKDVTFKLPGNGYKEMQQHINPLIKLPFDASHYYSAVVDHTYTTKGEYTARVYSWNGLSNKTVSTKVVVTDYDCSLPAITLYGGGESMLTASNIKYGREFRIDSRTNFTCGGAKDGEVDAKFEWGVYRADLVFDKNASGPPDKSRRLKSFPSNVDLNRSSISFSSLSPGYYQLQLTVTLSPVGISNSMQRYIMVMTPNVQATILGGSARSRGWETDIILDASESSDPLYPDNKNFTFEWRCKQVKNAYAFGKGGCFGNGNNLVESEESIFRIRNRSLLESVTYSFTVTVTPHDGNSRAGQFTQEIKIVQGDPPDINIRCLYNCANKVTSDEQLALEAYCKNCVYNSTKLEYLWSAMEVGTDTELQLWPSKTLTSKTSNYAVVKSNALQQDKEYILKVEAKRKGGASGFAQQKFKTNSPPRDGECRFEKNEVEELKTLQVSCEDWKEEDTPLTYEVLINKNGKLVLLWYGPELRDCKVILEAGRKENNYTVELIARVKDVYGAVADTRHNIKVTPMSASEVTSDNFLTSAGSLSDVLARGDAIGAIQIASALGSIINERAVTISSKDKALIRTKLVDGMAKIVPQDLQAVRQLTGALETITGEPEELEVDAQVSCVSIFSRSVDVVTGKAQGDDIGPAQIELASQTAFSAITNTLVASASSSRKLFNNSGGSAGDLEKSKSSSSKLVELTNRLASATLKTKVPGENATLYKANQQTLSVMKILSDDLDKDTHVEKTTIHGFQLPGKDVLFNGVSEVHEQIGLMESTMSINPFSGTNSSSMINTDAMSLIVTGNSSKELKIEGLSSYIDIYLQNKNPPAKDQVNTTIGRANMTVHKLSNVRSKTTILVDVIPQNRSIPLNIYLKYNDHPSDDDYDLMTSLPRYHVNETDNITSPGPYTFIVPSDYINRTGSYYIGVKPSQNGTDVRVNYTFDPLVSGCYYWDQKQEIWTSDGCKVGNKTTRTLTHCQCTHLTWFGGDLFIPPNKLDVKKAIGNLSNLGKSWPLLITICIVAGLYVLAMVWARRQDRKDLTKIGLIVVPDNDLTDHYRYEVTVYTGRMARRTTSNISVILYGEQSESHPIALKDEDEVKPIFESGSIDSFLVTVPVALGPLNYLRIWHDNSGVWPSWYLNQVMVRDIDTDETFVFLCYRWFACDEDDGQVVRLVPVAGKEELREFTYLFRNRAKKDFSDAHLWFSIALRPPRSVFTRVQRISCCFSLLLCTMLANVMWYDRGAGKTENDTVIFKSGFITLTWSQILIGIQSSIIVFPINLLIVQIFRNTKRKPKKKRKPKEVTKLKGSPSKNDQILRLNDIQAIPRSESSAAFLETPQENFKSSSIVNKIQKKSLVGRKDSFDEDLLLLLKETRMLEDPEICKSIRSLRISDKDSIDLEPVDVVKAGHFNEEFEMRKKSVSPMSECSFDWADDSKLVKPVPQKKETLPVQIRIPKLKFLFPWWFVFVGWFIVVCTSVVAAFFTILYGNEFDLDKQKQWLISMFFSIAQDIFISQPLKVIGFALFFALVWKKPEKENPTLTAELAKDEEWLKENVGGKRRNALIAQQPKYLPPDEVMLKKARIRRFKERKMFSVIREIALYAMFVWVVLVIAYGHRDPNSQTMNQGIENMLTGKGNSWLVDYTHKKPRNETIRKFLQVSGVSKYWNWTKTILLPSLFNGPWYNGKKDDPGFMADRSSWVLGVARIRQLRVKTDTCEVSSVFQGFLDKCNEPYSWSNEDTTAQFKPGWSPASSNYTTTNQAWKYRTGNDLKSLPFLGRMAFYSGGGYAVDLGPTLKDAKKKLQDLESNAWIDKLTRAVFVELTIYNPYTNLYSVIFLVLEVSASGGTFPFVELLITRIDRYAGNFMIFVLIFELAFVAFLIFFTYKLVKSSIKIGPRYYFKKYWSWVELALVGLCWTAVVLYFVRFGINTLTQMNYRKTPNEFVNFHHLAVSDQLFGYIFAFVVFLVSLKFLRLFRFNRRMSLLASTLRNASVELWCFSLVFGVVFMAFVHFSYLVFSTDLYMFHSVMSTVETLISVMLGKFSYERLLVTNRILAPLMFFFYSVLVVFVLINMFISIIIENFNIVKSNNDLQSNEYEIVDFMMDQFKVWLGWSSWGVMFSKNKVGAYPGGKPKYKKRKRVTQADHLQNRVDRLVDLIQEVYCDEPDFEGNDEELHYLLSSSNSSGETDA